MEKPQKKIELNIPQMYAVHAEQKNKTLEWGRGTGKSTILAFEVAEMVRQMPRGRFFISGETYQQILTNTLPSTIDGLEMFGLYKDVHFFIGRKGMKSWDQAYQAPAKYHSAIHFFNGATFMLVSQDKNAGGGRGANTDGGIVDEAAKLKWDPLYYDVLATNRGNIRRFAGAAKHHQVVMASTTPLTAEGRWFIEQEEKANKDPKRRIHIKANAFHNRHNLGDEWFEEMKAQSQSPLHYNAEILNIRPSIVTNGFYGQLKPDVHYYTSFNDSRLEQHFEDHLIKSGPKRIQTKLDCRDDGDVNLQEELDISIDWGVTNVMTVSQLFSKREYRFLKDFWVKHPKILDHLIEDFIAYYQYHEKKVINFYFDVNGLKKKGGKSDVERVEQMLRSAGWIVRRKSSGQNPPHDQKYKLWGILLRESDLSLPRIRINKVNCSNLIVSMENAPAIEGATGVTKDKSSEKKTSSIPQEQATHLSDAGDYPVFARFYRLVGRKLPSFSEFNFLG